jgi:hypothetical protein
MERIQFLNMVHSDGMISLFSHRPLNSGLCRVRCSRGTVLGNMPDPVRVAATEKVTYDGAFRPTFVNAEMFCALGLTVGDLFDNTEWFSSAQTYRQWLDVARQKMKDVDDARSIFTLRVYAAGVWYGDRCNITLHMPEEWPQHHLMLKLLQGSGMFDDDNLTNVGTFQAQITGLKTFDGWHDIHTTGLVNEGFAARISNAL